MSVPRGGNCQRNQCGDLAVHFGIERSPIFTRKAMDILSKVSISYLTAILGGEATVPTIHGDVVIKIPPGTQPGDIKRIPGRGIQSSRAGEKGCHFVTLLVDLPR